MRIGGKTFGEKDMFGVEADSDLNTAYDQSKFFHNFYQVDSKSEFDDRSTIGHMVTKSASRFHYNAVENGIIRAIAHRDPPPYGGMVRAWEFAQSRRNLKLLDVGSGTGHWIEFFIDSQYVSQAVGLEVAPNIIQFLKQRFADQPAVRIINVDVAADDFQSAVPTGPFDYISAIGVMFHITDDSMWLQAIKNLQSVLAPDGLIFIGGDFGSYTRNLQFHRVDEFDDWRAQEAIDGSSPVYVNKRVRSLVDWHKAATEASLAIVDLVRVDSDWAIHSPENDLVVLSHAET